MTNVFTTVLVVRDGSVLLGYKKRGFGVHKWNGFGGKPKDTETILEAADRELLEESGLRAGALKKIATLVFTVETRPEIFDEIHVFAAEDIDGEPIETEEMRPKWFSLNELPYEEMWEDAPLWVPKALAGDKFHFTCHYSNENPGVDYRNIVRYELTPVNE